ncbi:acyltransferase family protein [Neomicrococcus aestuarii]|nr:acyltransferase [Neomicrococcus aestuarii]
MSTSKQPHLRKSLGEALSDRNNILNLVRLVLAASVIVAHAWPLTGSLVTPGLEFLGVIAVEGFFIISGYLIVASRMNSGFVSFIWKRIIRIMPGYWMVLLLIGFVFSPLASWMGNTALNVESSVNYVVSNWFLNIRQWGIEGTLESVPYPNAWNGSLWTLWYEFRAYLAIGIVLSVGWIRRKSSWGLPLMFVLSVVVWALFRGPLEVSTNSYLAVVRLGSYFLAGAAFYALRKVLPIRFSWILAAMLMYLALFQIGWNSFYGHIPLGYLLLAAGSLSWKNLTTKNDLSYGVYIYAFPVQQLLVLGGSANLGLVSNILLTLLITLAMAWLSWVLVERPALRFKDLPDKLRNRNRRTSSI